MMETKKDKFKRIAEARTNKIIGMIDLLGNLSNKSNYEYSEKEVKQIFEAIESELKEVKSRFSVQENTGKTFKLK